jgi:hypothetical protein
MADEKTLRKIEEELLNAGFSVQAVVQAFRVYDDAQESKRTFDLPDWMAFDKVVQEKDHLLYALQAVKRKKDDQLQAQAMADREARVQAVKDALEIKRLQAVKREKDDQLQAQALEIKRLQAQVQESKEIKRLQVQEIKRLKSEVQTGNQEIERLLYALQAVKRGEVWTLLRSAKRWYESYMKNNMGQDLESCESRIRLAEVVCRMSHEQ